MESPNAEQKKTVLVMEDEPSIASVCHRVLTKEGLEVDIAANGKAAQTMIDNKQYDALLVDIRTPDMDGKQFYRWLEGKHPQLKRRLVFTTGDTIGGDTQAFIQKTSSPFLPKPFTPSELIAIMKKILK